MTPAGITLFLLAAFAAVLTALGTIVVRSPIRAAVMLLGHIISLSALFVSLHAHLLAALQLLIYAGAVVVLFIFVIMLIGPASEPGYGTVRGVMTKSVAGVLMALVGSAVAFGLAGVELARPIIKGCPQGVAECDQFGGASAFAHSLYRDGLVPFELISILLTVAIIGAIAVGGGTAVWRRHAVQQQGQAEAKQPRQASSPEREQPLAAEVPAPEGAE